MESITILVVDDEEGMRLAITRTLSRFAVHVEDVGKEYELSLHEAGSAEEALEKIESESPDIILLDQKLPGMSGIDLMEKISGTKEAPLVVMITAYATIETAIQATKKGAYDFLPKPFTPEELRNTVTKAVQHSVLAAQAHDLEKERRQVRFEFLSVLAHELKSPLNAVQGFVDIMLDQGDSLSEEERNTILNRSSVRLHYMRKMIDDLLDLTRIESGRKKRELQEIDVCGPARRAIDTATPDAEEKSVEINLHCEGDTVFTCDPGELEIILNNLISNAVKYNRKGGSVAVAIDRRDGALVIGVSDTGIGMSREDTEKLFRDFVRIKNEKTRGIPGSGLGLSIVKKIVDLYDGDIDVESTPDEGSTFTVTLNQAPLPASMPMDQRQ